MRLLRHDLAAAKALIDKPEKWTQSPGPDGDKLNANAAVFKVTNPRASAPDNSERFERAIRELSAQVPMTHHRRAPLYIYNQHASHSDIMSLFDRAIEAAS